MYKELDKYKTYTKATFSGSLPDEKKIEIKLDQYNFKLGELMADFIAHNNKPFWRRKSYHNRLNKVYIDVLNSIEIAHGF